MTNNCLHEHETLNLVICVLVIALFNVLILYVAYVAYLDVMSCYCGW